MIMVWILGLWWGLLVVGRPPHYWGLFQWCGRAPPLQGSVAVGALLTIEIRLSGGEEFPHH